MEDFLEQDLVYYRIIAKNKKTRYAIQILRISYIIARIKGTFLQSPQERIVID